MCDDEKTGLNPKLAAKGDAGSADACIVCKHRAECVNKHLVYFCGKFEMVGD